MPRVRSDSAQLPGLPEQQGLRNSAEDGDRPEPAFRLICLRGQESVDRDGAQDWRSVRTEQEGELQSLMSAALSA